MQVDTLNCRNDTFHMVPILAYVVALMNLGVAFDCLDLDPYFLRLVRHKEFQMALEHQ